MLPILAIGLPFWPIFGGWIFLFVLVALWLDARAVRWFRKEPPSGTSQRGGFLRDLGGELRDRESSTGYRLLIGAWLLAPFRSCDPRAAAAGDRRPPRRGPRHLARLLGPAARSTGERRLRLVSFWVSRRWFGGRAAGTLFFLGWAPSLFDRRRD